MGKNVRKRSIKRKYTPRKRSKYIPKKTRYSKKGRRFVKGKGSRAIGSPKKMATSHWLSYGKSAAKHVGPRISPLMKQLTAPNVQTVCDSGFLPLKQGKQAFAILASAYTPYDLVNASSVAVTTKVYLDNCYQSTTVTNQNNFNVFIDIYDIGTKYDYILAAASGDASPVLSIGRAGANTGGSFDAPGQSIFGASEFVNLYNVLKTTRLCLGSGETWQHNTVHKPQRMWNGAKLDNITPGADSQYFKGLTTFTMAVVYGGPVDLGTATAALTAVTTGGVDSGNVNAANLNVPHISWITSKTYVSRNINDNTQNNAITNNLTTNVNYATYHVMEKDGDNNIEIDA